MLERDMTSLGPQRVYWPLYSDAQNWDWSCNDQLSLGANRGALAHGMAYAMACHGICHGMAWHGTCHGIPLQMPRHAMANAMACHGTCHGMESHMQVHMPWHAMLYAKAYARACRDIYHGISHGMVVGTSFWHHGFTRSPPLERLGQSNHFRATINCRH